MTLLSEQPVESSGEAIDFEFEAELARVEAATAVEREWMDGANPFLTDSDILLAADAGQLRKVQGGVGYLCRQYLRDWEPIRSNPDHEFHYSPPYLQQGAVETLGLIGHAWARRLDWGHALSVTSMARSAVYQTSLAKQPGKLTIDPALGWSSHVYGYAFDIDGCGFFARVPDGVEGRYISVNPRMDRSYEEQVDLGRSVLKEILEDEADKGHINFVEELAGTSNHCFHVCVKPLGRAALVTP